MLANTFQVDYPIYKVLVFLISTYSESIVPVLFLVLHTVSQLKLIKKTKLIQFKYFNLFNKKKTIIKLINYRSHCSHNFGRL